MKQYFMEIYKFTPSGKGHAMVVALIGLPIGVYSVVVTLICTLYYYKELCVGGSKGKPVLYSL